MTYQELMQEKIEEASIDYQLSERPICLGGDAFADDVRRLNINQSFIAGANFLLDNLWISVYEDLPSPCQNCLVIHKDGFLEVARYDEIIGWCREYRIKQDVTHWMPIPKLKGGKKCSQS